MKKKLIFTLIAFTGILFLTSCSDQDEITYSCNEAVDTWTKSNIAKIQNMNRTAWKALPAEKKRAAYRAFTPEQKVTFWKDKFTGILALNLTKEEREHIKLVYDFIIEHQDFFNNRRLTDEEKNTLDLFFYKWITIAQQEFGWDMKLLVAIAASGEDFNIRRGNNGILYSNDFDPSINVNDKDCHCNTGPVSDFCNVASQGLCEKTDCIKTNYGCGWIWLGDCNGRCSDVYL